MAWKRGVRLNLSRQRIEALKEICEEMAEEFAPANDHQLLLREYLLELRTKLTTLLKREQEKYLLNLTGTEATAFYQLWNIMDLSRDKYASLIVNSMLQKISVLAA
jgi:hypothetical protein